MKDPPASKRTYRSAHRQEQARQTRKQILDTALRLFSERGYHATSIEAIAREAQVAPETIYASFGNKLALLTRLVDVSIVGDEEPIPLLHRAEIKAAETEPDPVRLIESFAANIAGIMGRMSPVFALLRENEKSDANIAAMLERLLTGRMEGMRYFVKQVQRTGALRESLSLEEAAETTWALSSSEIYRLLTIDRGWSREQYVRWLADILTRILLNLPTPR
ncbi:MAG TPA: helix-turn-helix domain-containing protein [Anaerolineaceae bacterium]|nr:helix-turn-helix domain-containing protein [Anaerolineaceae bacterium]